MSGHSIGRVPVDRPRDRQPVVILALPVRDDSPPPSRVFHSDKSLPALLGLTSTGVVLATLYPFVNLIERWQGTWTPKHLPRTKADDLGPRPPYSVCDVGLRTYRFGEAAGYGGLKELYRGAPFRFVTGVAAGSTMGAISGALLKLPLPIPSSLDTAYLRGLFKVVEAEAMSGFVTTALFSPCAVLAHRFLVWPTALRLDPLSLDLGAIVEACTSLKEKALPLHRRFYFLSIIRLIIPKAISAIVASGAKSQLAIALVVAFRALLDGKEGPVRQGLGKVAQLGAQALAPTILKWLAVALGSRAIGLALETIEVRLSIQNEEFAQSKTPDARGSTELENKPVSVRPDPYEGGVLGCAKTMVEEEGWSALFRGWRFAFVLDAISLFLLEGLPMWKAGVRSLNDLA